MLQRVDAILSAMSTLSLQDIGLRPAQLKAVERKARHAGTTTPQYVRLLVEQDLLADKSFNEILGPIREDFRKSGMTEQQLDELVGHARRASRPARRGSATRSSGARGKGRSAGATHRTTR